MKHIFISLLVVVALSSCSKDEPREPYSNEGTIRIYTGVEAPGSKAVISAATGMSEAAFVAKEGTVSPMNDFSGGTFYKGAVEATSGKVTFSGTAPGYNVNDNNTYFVAYYPAQTLAGDVATWPINGYTDIMITNTIWDAGRYSSPHTGATGAKLNFNHQLSQVEVVCKAEAGSAHSVVKAAWGRITAIEFLAAPTTLTYTLTTVPTVTATGSAAFAMLKSYSNTGNTFDPIDIPANGNVSVNAVAMLYPVAPTASESFRLKVYTEGPAGGSAIAVEVPVDLGASQAGMVRGQTHKVTLSFSSDTRYISASATTIDNWQDGASGDSGIIKP